MSMELYGIFFYLPTISTVLADNKYCHRSIGATCLSFGVRAIILFAAERIEFDWIGLGKEEEPFELTVDIESDLSQCLHLPRVDID